MFSGHLPVPMSTLVYKIEGTRLVAMVDVMEILDVMLEEEGAAMTITSSVAPQMLKECVTNV